MTDGTKDILLSTKQGMSICFKEEEVRAMGRSAYESDSRARARARLWTPPSRCAPWRPATSRRRF
jgi:hypothetical protein